MNHLKNAPFFSDWTPVTRGVDLHHNLEAVPLQIRLKAIVGSGDTWTLLLKNEQGAEAGAFSVTFESNPQYKIGFCQTSTSFASKLPSTEEKLWTIEWDTGKLSVSCNGKIMIKEFAPSDATCTDPDYSVSWRDYWERDKTKIFFESDDNMSTFYRMQPGTLQLNFCPAFTFAMLAYKVFWHVIDSLYIE